MEVRRNEMKKFNMMLVLMLVLAAVILLGGCAQADRALPIQFRQLKRSRLLRSVRGHQRKRQA